ncbi:MULTISPECIES: hypothetical protein [Pseudomonas]|uniref:hypothetical protein n=1 Tax=Pseudomonas TaxID=286 RepID=UPI00110C99F7|nr:MULTISPECIES: hypothetical protein [Pseudomonas]MBW4794412.1 hypothetical protein [Pseudomonas tolaasii]
MKHTAVVERQTREAMVRIQNGEDFQQILKEHRYNEELQMDALRDLAEAQGFSRDINVTQGQITKLVVEQAK